ncbi:MAG TPA: hypothetical protein DFS52_32445 [Myxococcales bacterium]|nr:hypothetical protein [Myxococcales bacterium]
MRRLLALALVWSLPACSRTKGEERPEAPSPRPPSAQETRPVEPETGGARCPPGPAAHALQRAVGFYDAGDFEEAFACASLAATLGPGDPAAQSELGAALAALGRYEAARLAYATALAYDPNLLDALLGSAELYLMKLVPTRGYDELGLAYAARGRVEARRADDRQLAGRFALLEAVALNSLGQSTLALERADEALAAAVEPIQARAERAFALWELCRFEEAKGELEALLAFDEWEAVAHFQLGQLAERQGDLARAGSEMALARVLDPERYPPELEVSTAALDTLVRELVAGLPADMRRDLEQVDVATEELPDLADLTAAQPPLSPAIVGLFRGPPLGEPCSPKELEPGPCRAIRLYRKNLLRSVGSMEELRRQVRITLVHEIGHLRGEDDLELVARGLE